MTIIINDIYIAQVHKSLHT